MAEIRIRKRIIGEGHLTYTIADIAANHDGDLERAKMLIRLARESGADAAKFQNFRAPEIVSDYGFKNLAVGQAHQASWKKSVFDVYQDYSIPWDWTSVLKETCEQEGIDYFSTPYDFASVDHLEKYVDVYKVGSGDITWLELIKYIAEKGKLVLLSTGASTLLDVKMAAEAVLESNPNLVLMQCNTNYSASMESYKNLNLRVLDTYRCLYPDLVLGFSDHTQGPAAVLGAVALGARVVERHFTDDNNREGPDHKFATNQSDWTEMVAQIRLLDAALGDGVKRVEENEKESLMVQQRSLWAARNLNAGDILTRGDVDILRPAPQGCINPQYLDSVIGHQLINSIGSGEIIQWKDIICK